MPSVPFALYKVTAGHREDGCSLVCIFHLGSLVSLRLANPSLTSVVHLSNVFLDPLDDLPYGTYIGIMFPRRPSEFSS
jgi:hypothetical protein